MGSSMVSPTGWKFSGKNSCSISADVTSPEDAGSSVREPQASQAELKTNTGELPPTRDFLQAVIDAIPEITVVIDRSAARLFTRINRHVHDGNHQMFFGQPYQVSIRPQPSAEEWRRLLDSTNVQHLREDKEVA